MDELFREIRDFPGYRVSTLGRIENENTGRIMRINRNGRGIPIVGLMFGGVQYKRSVPLLVATAFLESPVHESFDSVIHLDADRTNCNVANLMWRPHWFVVRYHQQFKDPERMRFLTEVYCPETGEYFRDSTHMAMTYGLLDRDIVAAHVNGDLIWPTKLTTQVML